MYQTMKLRDVEVLSHIEVNKYRLILVKQCERLIKGLKGSHCVGWKLYEI